MCHQCADGPSNHSAVPFNRREFLKFVAGAAALAAVADTANSTAYAATADGRYSSIEAVLASMKAERIARRTPVGYQSSPATSDHTVKWVQVDLGRSRKIDHIRLLPVLVSDFTAAYFPQKFKIEVSDDESFTASTIVFDHTKSVYPPPGDKILSFPSHGIAGRYVRLTATRLLKKRLMLSKLEVWSDGHNVAEGCRVTDSDQMVVYDAAAGGYITPAKLAHGTNSDQPAYELLRKVYPEMPDYNMVTFLTVLSGVIAPLTRQARPQGEGVVTDNPGNVIPVGRWKPVRLQARIPEGRDVKIGGGLFKKVMENNIGYLLNSFSVPELLRFFHARAGKANPPGLPPPIPFWDTDLPGSNAGRFMMGAGNTLRWMEHARLRNRLNEIVDGIAECQEPDGFAMGYHQKTIFYSEHGNYTRSWVTHGLVDAGYAGNHKAFQVIRNFADWFNQCPYLPQLLRRAGFGVQGMIPSTRLYFTPVGRPEDIQVMQRYYQENYWLEMLANRDPAAIWLYPYDHPHCYLLTAVTPYLDQYRATGEKKYLEAVLGAWDLYHCQWQHIGGAISICECYFFPPKSAFLNLKTGENCGSSFWVSLNHSLHQLFPVDEKYSNEIEKSIYNVLIANQAGDSGIRYHTNLNGRKEIGTARNTCCEGQGTRQLGSLPQYIYSVDSGGIFINLFAASALTFRKGTGCATFTMTTEFPYQPEVKIAITASRPMKVKVRLRIPQWAARDMPIIINGKSAAVGTPGTYHILDRTWSDGDTVAFTLPMNFRLTLYTGIDQVTDGLRYALEYGPLLMAAVSANADRAAKRLSPHKARKLARNVTGSTQWNLMAATDVIELPVTADELSGRLTPIADQPLHFAIDGDPDHKFMPYWQIDQELFTCFPVLKTPTSYPRSAIGPDDLALASKGATARSDSELSTARGCTAKLIDGIVATPADFSRNRWRSAETPHPHWVEVKLPKEEIIGKVVIDFADPLDHPTSFQGLILLDGKEHPIFDVTNYPGWRKYVAQISPVRTDTFRLIIRESADPLHPNAAQISQIELYPPV